jgi:Ca-activated chloride channel family protein
MPSRGSYPVAAIAKAQKLLEQAGVALGEVLLVTDGGTSPAAERAAADLQSSGYSLSVLGVGTRDGAPIPRAGGGFVTDRSGNIVVPRIESAALRSLAAAGGGRFVALTADDSDIKALLSGPVGTGSATDESLATDQWEEEGPWLLLLLVPMAAMAFRRGLVLVLLVFLLPVAEPVYAFTWDDLWLTRDQQAQIQLDEGNALEAGELFEDTTWQAVAKYRAGDYAPSAAGFSTREDVDNLYNLGNALARLGELETAIDAYEDVLEIDPAMEDALYNRDLLKDLLEQSQDSQSGEQGNQENSSESGGGAEQSEGQSQSDQSSEEGSSGDPGAEGESSVRDQENTSQEDLDALQAELERAAQEAQQQSGEAQEQQGMSEAEAEQMRRSQEQRQAMEQWLRRIPNDPGGLLRRKFRYQYQRQGKDQDGNNLWPDDEVQPW